MAQPLQDAGPLWLEIDRLAAEVAQIGRQIDLPLTAASSNLADPLPMRDAAGRPYAETRFQWIEADEPYWLNRRLALNVPVLKAVRLTSEPFYFDGARLMGWRPNGVLQAVDAKRAIDEYGVAAAIVAPVHLPFGVLGAVVWGSASPLLDLRAAFMANAEPMFALALKLISAHAEASSLRAPPLGAPTAREVQCVRWAALGKTDFEIAHILEISVPTVRFHLKNAARKLEACSRSHAVYRATALGYVGANP
jgi:DNA-binding CsgD family transcriptional regulator